MLWHRLISIGNKQIWLDGTSSNGSFIWNNEAKSLLSEGFTAWVAGQPDNFQNKEKCLMMNSLGRWIDVNCKSKGYVICEKCMNCETAEKAAATPATTTTTMTTTTTTTTTTSSTTTKTVTPPKQQITSGSTFHWSKESLIMGM